MFLMQVVKKISKCPILVAMLHFKGLFKFCTNDKHGVATNWHELRRCSWSTIKWSTGSDVVPTWFISISISNQNYLGVKIINSWDNYFHLGKIKKVRSELPLWSKIIIFGSKIIIYEIQNNY